MQKNILVSLVITVFLLNSCENNSTDPIQKTSYTPLSVGNITQIVYIPDSSTTSLEIVDTAVRADGQKVYKGLFKSGTFPPTVSHYYVSDAYFITTELDTVRSDSQLIDVNPFREQRLAKKFPLNDDTWLHTIGDTMAHYFIAADVESYHALWGEVKNSFRYDLYDKSSSLPFMSLFYGPNLGWIGTSSGFDKPAELQFVCSYKYVSGETYGELWPERNPNPIVIANYKMVDTDILNFILFGRSIRITGEKFLK